MYTFVQQPLEVHVQLRPLPQPSFQECSGASNTSSKCYDLFYADFQVGRFWANLVCSLCNQPKIKITFQCFYRRNGS